MNIYNIAFSFPPVLLFAFYYIVLLIKIPVSYTHLDVYKRQAYAEENPYDLELSQRKLVAIASVLAMDTDVILSLIHIF